MQFKENEIIESTISLMTLQNILLIHTKSSDDPDTFRQQINTIIQSLTLQKQKLEKIINYLKETPIETNYEKRGAKLMNNVLAFNCAR